LTLGVRGLPRQTRARISRRRPRGSSATLTVVTTARTPAGRYSLRLWAASGEHNTTLLLALTIKPGLSSLPFTVAGTATGLEPGVPQPLNLKLTNSNPLALTVTSLRVSVQTVDAPRATADHACALADFSVQQFAGLYPLTVPSSSTRTLADLGISSAQWPQVAILDRPLNQDGCQGATLRLSYSGSGTRP
jgi:hypothetical protein